MANKTNHFTLMHGRSVLGKKPTRLSVCKDGESPELLNSCGFSFIFVLQGEVECSFRTQAATTLKSSEVMVINRMQLRTIRCNGDTVILEFETPPRLTISMSRISRIFGMARSEILTLNESLQRWCEAVTSDISSDQDMEKNKHDQFCRKLTTILLTYTKQQLGTLYVPLYACSNHCDHCR